MVIPLATVHGSTIPPIETPHPPSSSEGVLVISLLLILPLANHIKIIKVGFLNLFFINYSSLRSGSSEFPNYHILLFTDRKIGNRFSLMHSVTTLSLNYSEIPNSCLLIQFVVCINLLYMLINSWNFHAILDFVAINRFILSLVILNSAAKIRVRQ